MSAEKTEALLIRQVDFSETSRIVTLFTIDFGKVAALAKGAKRLKGPFEGALDLLTTSHVVFLRKTSSNLQLLTEAKLKHRFQPVSNNISNLYAGYYVAELLDSLTTDFDPHPELYHHAQTTLKHLGTEQDFRRCVLRFEFQLLDSLGLLPQLDQCACGKPILEGQRYAFWVTQGVLLCSKCQRAEVSSRTISSGTLAAINRLLADDSELSRRIMLSNPQIAEMRYMLTASISQIIDRKPKMLRYLNF